MLLADIDWTNVLVALIAGLPAIIAAFYARGAHVEGKTTNRQIRTPSGDTIGVVAERTHDLAAVATLSTAAAMKQGSEPPPVTASGPLHDAVRRLNSDPSAPVKVNGEAEGMHD